MRDSAQGGITSMSFTQFLHGDVVILRLMGLASMRSVFDDGVWQSRWWEVAPFCFGVSIIIFTALSEMRTLSQVIQYDLNYAIEIFTAICPGVLCAVKSSKLTATDSRWFSGQTVNFTACSGIFMGIRLWTHRADLHRLLSHFNQLWDSASSRGLLVDDIKDAAQKTQFMRFCYTIVVTVLVSSYAVRPYILLIDHRLRQQPNESFDFSMTVYPSSYSFPTDTPFSYFMCVTYEQIVIVFVALYWISCDTLFAQLTTHICIHYRVLAKEIVEVIQRYDGEWLEMQLRDISKRHHQMFLYCDSVVIFFNPIIFLTVLVNGANLCCCVYRLEQEVSSGNWDEVAKNLFHTITLMIQTVIYCGYADTLTRTSAEVGHAVYHSPWPDQNQKCKQMLLMILMRAQKEYKCSAYGMISLNLNQVTKIGNTAASFFALLRSLS